jgi:hypothetical protein
MAKIEQIYQTDEVEWLDDQRPLWRYISYETMFLYLKGKVFIPSIEKLREKDPFEGNFCFPTSAFNKALHDRYGGKHQAVNEWIRDKLCTDGERKQINVNKLNGDYSAKIYQRRYLEFLRKTRYAWCWFLSGIESALMWNSYGRGGVAVGTNVGKLKSAVAKSDQEFVFGQMAYRSIRQNEFDSGDPINLRLLTRSHFFKREEYKDEREVRFVTTGPGNDLILNLRPTDWISEFRLNPMLKANEAQAIKSVIKDELPNVRCERSNLLYGPAQGISNVGRLSCEMDIQAFKCWKHGRDEIPNYLKNDALSGNEPD